MGKKTSKDVSTQQVDPAMAKESHALVNLFKGLASSGPVMNEGVTIADFTPATKAAHASTEAAAAAFGAPTAAPASGPTAEASASGVMGFRPSIDAKDMLSRVPKAQQRASDQFYKDVGKQKNYKAFKPKSGGGGKK